MIPIRDSIPTRRFPIITVLLILTNIGVFVLQMLVLGAGGEEALQQAVLTFGVVPARVAQVLASWGSNVARIGASGAIAGVLAAYLIFFPRAR